MVVEEAQRFIALPGGMRRGDYGSYLQAFQLLRVIAVTGHSYAAKGQWLPGDIPCHPEW